MIKRGIAAYKGKRILMLQGPVGPFFARLAKALESIGAQVSKIDFNGGDWLFSPHGSIPFRGSPDEWPAFIERVLLDKQIDVVFLFGDCRPLHRVAHEIADKLDLEIGVFEEGYIRPDYITLEKYGVNGHSRIPRTPLFYLSTEEAEFTRQHKVGNTFWHAAFWAVTYYTAATVLKPVFPHYVHHRPLSMLEGLPWIRGIYRKALYQLKERGIQEQLVTSLSKRYFLVPLQVHNDAQVHMHSEFDSVKAFINRVMRSFAAHAAADTTLVIKHHPMDRAYHDYARFIRKSAKAHGIHGRLRYIHDQHLPTLLKHARGVVVINSTVGLSALHHGTPLKVCGQAIYDMEGLTFQGGLDDFWKQAVRTKPSRELFNRFENYLIAHTQLNGSFYRRLKVPEAHAGVVRPRSVEEHNAITTQAASAMTPVLAIGEAHHDFASTP